MKTKKPKLTPEQQKERRLWQAADKACRALLENMQSPVRDSSLSFSLERGISMHTMLSFTFAVPKKKGKTWVGPGGAKITVT